MIGFILAGALGAIALIVYLLFRRLRSLSWQLTQLRVERDCERILREIGIPSGTRPVATAPPALPVRRKRHLSLYLGGLGALVSVREAARRHRPALVASGAATAVAMSAAALILATSLNPPQEGPAGPTVSVTLVPSPTLFAPPSRSGPGRRAGPTPGATSTSGAAPGPPGHGQMGGSSTLAPSGPVHPTSGLTPIGPPASRKSLPASPPPTSSAPATPSAPTSSRPGKPPNPRLLCARVRTLLELELCAG
jgi:hypothetical protein